MRSKTASAVSPNLLAIRLALPEMASVTASAVSPILSVSSSALPEIVSGFFVSDDGEVLIEALALEVARAWGVGPPLTWILAFLTRPERAAARARGVNYHYLFMRPDGAQLAELVSLVDAGQLRPEIDRRYPLKDAAEALAYVEAGHAAGKVLVVP